MKLLKSKAFLGAVCIVLAAVIAFGVLPWVYRSQAETVSVVRVAQDIPTGTVITRAMLTTAETNGNSLSKKVVLTADEAVGKVASQQLYAGEFLWSDRIMTEEAYSELEEAKTKGISSGRCLVTIAFPTASAGIASVLRAGNIVDVYEIGEDEEKVTVVTKALPSMYVYDVLNKKLESLNKLDELKENATLEEDTDYDFEPAYVVFRCTEEEAGTLIRLEKDKALHLTLTKAEG